MTEEIRWGPSAGMWNDTETSQQIPFMMSAVFYIIKEIANIKETSFEDVKKITVDNAKKVFDRIKIYE